MTNSRSSTPWFWGDPRRFGAIVADIITPEASNLEFDNPSSEGVQTSATHAVTIVKAALNEMVKLGCDVLPFTEQHPDDVMRVLAIIAPGELTEEGTAARVIHERITGNNDNLFIKLDDVDEGEGHCLRLVAATTTTTR